MRMCRHGYECSAGRKQRFVAFFNLPVCFRVISGRAQGCGEPGNPFNYVEIWSFLVIDGNAVVGCFGQQLASVRPLEFVDFCQLNLI
jgi:hypothetical protein